MSEGPTYYVLLIGHRDRMAVHITPSLSPRVPCAVRLMSVAGPFPTLVRALHAQKRMAEEWRCYVALPDHDAFVKEHWRWSVGQEKPR